MSKPPGKKERQARRPVEAGQILRFDALIQAARLLSRDYHSLRQFYGSSSLAICFAFFAGGQQDV
jgi:hypothetical protein